MKTHLFKTAYFNYLRTSIDRELWCKVLWTNQLTETALYKTLLFVYLSQVWPRSRHLLVRLHRRTGREPGERDPLDGSFPGWRCHHEPTVRRRQLTVAATEGLRNEPHTSSNIMPASVTSATPGCITDGPSSTKVEDLFCRTTVVVVRSLLGKSSTSPAWAVSCRRRWLTIQSAHPVGQCYQSYQTEIANI